MHNSTFYINLERLQKIAEGDERNFCILLEEIVPWLEKLIFKVLKDEQAVEEVLQETFIRLWLNRDKLPELEKISLFV